MLITLTIYRLLLAYMPQMPQSNCIFSFLKNYESPVIHTAGYCVGSVRCGSGIELAAAGQQLIRYTAAA